jgi:hypothetical protein
MCAAAMAFQVVALMVFPVVAVAFEVVGLAVFPVVAVAFEVVGLAVFPVAAVAFEVVGLVVVPVAACAVVVPAAAPPVSERDSAVRSVVPECPEGLRVAAGASLAALPAAGLIPSQAFLLRPASQLARP